MVGQTVRPGTWLVDLIPGCTYCLHLLFSASHCVLVRHLPSWLPFQKYGRLGKAQIYRFVTRPFEYVKKQIVKSYSLSYAPQSDDRPILGNRMRPTIFCFRVARGYEEIAVRIVRV